MSQRKKRVWIAVLVLALFPSLVFGREAPHVAVPWGSSILVDGTLGREEWDGALEIAVGSRCSLFVRHDRQFLYLGVRSAGRGFGSPCVVQSGSVRVLHASAALGTALYRLQDEVWVLDRAFEWECRDADSTGSELSQERQRYLEREGWVGSTGGMGSPYDVEYAIALPESPMRMQFLFYDTGSFPRMVAWPGLPTDQAAWARLLDGRLPEHMSFEIGAWACLEVQDLD